MGGAVSTGEDNEDLIDNLVEADYIKTKSIESIFRCVDRGEYYLPDHRENAYKDLAWKHGNIHMSAPCIYSEVMEALQLQTGMSFLNLGSGTGYLSTLAGLAIGPYGVNHGVELWEDVVEYAKGRLEHFRKTCPGFDEFEFCDPQFTVGNCLLLNGARLYDRVYCGAACPPEHESFMKNLISIGGILVMPVNEKLLQVTRTGETSWETKSVLPVSFASLILPTSENGVDIIELPEIKIMSLQEICRVSVRRILQAVINAENPEVNRVSKKPKRKTPKPKPAKQRRINIVPMNMGMMILGQWDSDEDADHQADGDPDAHRMEDGEEEEEGAQPGIRSNMEVLRQLVRAHRRMRQIEEQDEDSEEEDSDHSNDRHGDSDTDMGLGDEDAGPSSLEHEADGSPPKTDSFGSCSSKEEMEVGDSPGCRDDVTGGIPIHGHTRLSSSTSAGTSFTSGVGTSVSESYLDADSDSHWKALDSPLQEKPLDLSCGHCEAPPVPLENGSIDYDAVEGEPNGTNGKYLARTANGVHSSHSPDSGSDRPVPDIQFTTSEHLDEFCRGNQLDKDAEEDEKVLPCPEGVFSFSLAMREKIESLPIPHALKGFLAYYRS